MISPHEVMGQVEVVEHLSTVQDKVYEEATVLVVHNVTGEHRIWCWNRDLQVCSLYLRDRNI